MDLAACASLEGDALLHALLGATPVVDLELEDFLTAARARLLDAVTSATDGAWPPRFACALARQCFINEYVFACSANETAAIAALAARVTGSLARGEPPASAQLTALACYQPLCALAGAERLLEHRWPPEIDGLLTLQVREPQEEQRLRAAIPQLTPIDDAVSQAVRAQYEENPYPRWIKAPPARACLPVEAHLRSAFPHADIRSPGPLPHPDILVAGCGTGQHPIDTAQSVAGARVLAVDLSTASLAYALRKTRELRIETVDYAQADLLQLGALARRFDVIEASGVLHHLADPFAGWRALLALLRPGGFMKLGFYSETARRDIVRARELIAAAGFAETAEGIREARQYLRRIARAERIEGVLQGDFFSTSGCRDWLFHVQEHRLTLDAIGAFLREHDLALLGFQCGRATLQAYARRFAGDPAATDLACWRQFEREHPDTFGGMYQFWVQRC